MSHPASIVVATSNAGKLRELAKLLTGLDVKLVTQRDLRISDAVEDGLSFVENALIKARHAATHSGLPAVADDSGLMVDSLNGEPGIYSARYSGEHGDDAANNAKLLKNMNSVPKQARSARFVCCAVFVRHAADSLPIISQATWEGTILTSSRGDGGFGYDPLFAVPGHHVSGVEMSAAELPASIKNTISHRGKAIRLLVNALKADGFARA